MGIAEWRQMEFAPELADALVSKQRNSRRKEQEKAVRVSSLVDAEYACAGSGAQ